MVFDGNEMIRMATLPDMYERTITIGSAGKTFSVTGWKLGWALGPEHLLKNCQVDFYIFLKECHLGCNFLSYSRFFGNNMLNVTPKFVHFTLRLVEKVSPWLFYSMVEH